MAATKTKTAGAIKAGRGKYHFRVAKLRKVAAGTGYSTSHGGVVEGARMLFGYIHKPRGTGSRMHSHPNEQFNYVVKGTLMRVTLHIVSAADYRAFWPALLPALEGQRRRQGLGPPSAPRLAALRTRVTSFAAEPRAGYSRQGRCG